MANELPKHNNYENSRLSAGLNLYLSLGYKVIMITLQLYWIVVFFYIRISKLN